LELVLGLLPFFAERLSYICALFYSITFCKVCHFCIIEKKKSKREAESKAPAMASLAKWSKSMLTLL